MITHGLRYALYAGIVAVVLTLSGVFVSFESREVISGVSMVGNTPVCRTCRRPFSPGQELQATAQEAVNAGCAKQFLTVHCRSCTREGTFYGETRADAIRNARLEGWVYYEHEGQAREICPECPVPRKPAQRTDQPAS